MFDVGLIYKGDILCTLVGYSNSDYIGDLDAKRSITGYPFIMKNLLVSLNSIYSLKWLCLLLKHNIWLFAKVINKQIWLKGLFKVVEEDEELGYELIHTKVIQHL